ncbi:MAG TPA: ChaB family protein, partial [Candidatus Methanoperedens sp.]
MPTGNLPESGKKLWEEVYNKAKSGSCKDNPDVEKCAAGSAWKAVKNAGWHKSGDSWVKSADLEEFSLTIT